MAARITAYLVSLIVATTLIAGLIVGAQRTDDGPVDLIVVNGRVYTADGAGTMAEAVAVQGNKILRVGSSREVHRLRRPQTIVIDAKGGAVLPGFNDSHTHFLSGGLALTQINLLEAKTLAAVEDAIREWSATHADREWVTGRGWYYDVFIGGLPTRQILDALVPDRPAYLVAYDGHTGWANSRALRLAGITRRTPNPPNGIIVKDARTGEPTGVLKEAAMALMTPRLPKPTRDEQIIALRAAITEAHRRGVTSVQNASGSPEELELYDELRRNRELDVRVYAGLSIRPDISSTELDQLDNVRAKYPDDPLLKAGAAKLMADGVIETHTAAMLEPYSNRPTVSGEPRLSEAGLEKLVADLDKRGWQVMIHAIGDRAVRMALDALEYAAELNPVPSRGRRHRVEHIETIAPADVPRFGQLGVMASMQPYHGLPEAAQMEVWTGNIGRERAAHGWLYGSIAKAGGDIAFGSDWPVVTMDPLLGLHVAVNRTTPEGEPDGGWLPGERLALRQAIDGYTRNAAWASYDEDRKGSLKPDMLADIVILSKDIFSLAPARLAETEVMVTIFDGKVVYQRSTETDN
jgi:predicted amidohydrolase YtcJ